MLWRTKKDRWLLRLTLIQSPQVIISIFNSFVYLVRINIRETLNKLTPNKPENINLIQHKWVPITLNDENKPIIFISACENFYAPGGYQFNGGINEFNLLVKLLRLHGYKAFVVTFDGTYKHWLIEHQPHISLYEFHNILKIHPNVRCVTSWIISKAFIDECEKLYFWDMELCFTANNHFYKLIELYKKKIVKTAAISRTIQAWHMAHFKKTPVVIPNLLDTMIWKPNPEERIFNRIGYMNEGDHTQKQIEEINKSLIKSGYTLDFKLIKGTTEDVLKGIQSCNLFISTNIGKDDLWGEGCPRTIIEALSTGAVVLGYDIIGNREILINNFNGFIVKRYDIDEMILKIKYLYENTSEIDKMREDGLNLIQRCHTLENRWELVKEFLDL